MGISRCPRSTSTASWMRAARPACDTASIAARTVRPVYSTSSTRTTVAFSMRGSGGGSGASVRGLSSRQGVTSSSSTGGALPSTSPSFFAMRSARNTPRVRTPASSRFSVPLFFSVISNAMRVSARRTPSASMITAFCPAILSPPIGKVQKNSLPPRKQKAVPKFTPVPHFPADGVCTVFCLGGSRAAVKGGLFGLRAAPDGAPRYYRYYIVCSGLCKQPIVHK